jgi:hypothetical protein
MKTALVEKVQEFILAHDGFIVSTDTLRTEDLLGSVYNFLGRFIHYEDARKVCEEIAGYFTEEPTPFNRYYGRTELKDLESATEYYQDTVFNMLNEIAPEGYYYGSTEGDGACIGFFQYMEEDEDAWTYSRDPYEVYEMTPEEEEGARQQDLIDIWRFER